MIKTISDYFTNYYKWNTKIPAKSPTQFILKLLVYCLLTEVIYRLLAYCDAYFVYTYQIKNDIFLNGMFYLRAIVWFYLMFCTFNKLKLTFNKKLTYVVVPMAILVFLKWFFPYIVYQQLGFKFFVVAKTFMPIVLVLYVVFHVWFINNKEIKEKFKKK